ncbi:MAG: hypothetical protein P8J50_02980 [Acidimicrobiales bacterium]|nr:hypothetical protein [Acidimicrobiales bacterium]
MHPDDQFHPPTDADDPFWTETCWFTFTVPERRLSGQVYPFMRPNQNVTTLGVFIWDDEHGGDLLHCRYAKNLVHVPLPADSELTDLQLEGGLHIRCLEPLSRYAVHYLDADDGRLELDLEFTGIAPPNHMGGAHLDQPGRYTGTIRLDDETIEVDSYGFRDRSWMSRSQIGPTIGASPAPKGGYSYATASESDAFHVISMALDGTTDLPLHGYLIRDGVYSKLAMLEGKRTVLERADGDAPTRVRIEAKDELGRELVAEGRCLNKIGFYLNANLFTWNCLTEWEWGDGIVGYGEDHDNWSASAATRFFRELREGDAS